jgi:hypothetical protein
MKEVTMAQTLAQFDTRVSDRYGRVYSAKACGRLRDDRNWEGWIEFENEVTGETLRSPRETTQPNLTDLKYWATGLTPVYLEGSLDRTLPKALPRQPSPAPPPVFDAPAPRPLMRPRTHDAILNPFSVYEKSPDLLAQELTALRGWHLRQIIRDYQLSRENDPPLDMLSESELGSLIVERVRQLRA